MARVFTTIIFSAIILDLMPAFGREVIDNGNMSNIANSSGGIPCSHYKELFPYEHRADLDKQCKLEFTQSSKQYFTYKVTKFKYKLVEFQLQFFNMSSKSKIRYTSCVIQPTRWLWTFRGVDGNYGGRQYLTWPPEYGTLSVGMLKAHTSPPLRVNLTMKGDCGVVIGSVNTTMRLAIAFANFTNDLAMTLDEYNYSYWCYKERIFVESSFLFHLCQHVICPIETIGYRCCKHTYDVNKHDFQIQCPGDFYVFDGVWWVCPFVIGSLLYCYFALVLFVVLSLVYKQIPITRGMDGKLYSQLPTAENAGLDITNSESKPIKPKQWIHYNPVSVLSIIIMPLRMCCLKSPVITSRCIRFVFAISTVGILFIKVFVHSLYDRDFVIESVKQGAPMNFLSMIAGYELSKQNFLINLNGPYCALGMYLVSLTILICKPDYLADFLVMGLPERTNKPNFAFTLDLKLRELFGSRQIICNKCNGYGKILKTIQANIFSLLNPAFWKYILTLQTVRYKNAFESKSGTVSSRCLAMILFLLPYLALCVVELMLTILCYGLPTVFTVGLIYRAYSKNIIDWLRPKGRRGLFALAFILPISLILLTFTVYMFSIVFLDSFIFLSRVAIFTYTGLFANPSYTEGYVIFSITVSMYLYDSVHSINETYEQLFNQTKKVCKRIKKELPTTCPANFYRKDVEGAVVTLELFLHVVDAYKPKRVQILKAVLKITMIFLCLYISVGILTRFDGFQQLSVVTQTATTTFVCLVPKIFARMCMLNERRKILRIRSNVHSHVSNFLLLRGIDLSEYKIVNENLQGGSRTGTQTSQGPNIRSRSSFELL